MAVLVLTPLKVDPNSRETELGDFLNTTIY